MTDTEGMVSHAEIRPLLGVVKKSGSDLLAFCPSHADGQKHNMTAGHSLVLHASGVLECMAGCKFADVISALRAGAGQRRSGRAQPPQKKQDARGWPEQPKVAYEYRDAGGTLLAVKGRFERPNIDDPSGKPEKTFRWRLPEATNYHSGIKSRYAGGVTEMPLWGTDELVQADTGRRVWFAEGESATEAIRARNELATCGPWGASQRDFGDAFEVLRGRDVLLWPDNDSSGRDYMAEVRRHLRGVARSVAVIAAPVPPKGDAVEYFQARGTIEALLEGVLTGDAVEVITNDHLRVRLATEAGEVVFEAAELAEGSRDLDSELTVTWRTPTAEGPYCQRINLLSASAREGLARILGKHFAGAGLTWISIINRAVVLVRETLAGFDITDSSEPDPGARPAPFVIDGLVVEGGGTILHGLPKRGKSQAALAMTVAIDAGLPSGVFRVARARPCLYINLERSRDSMLARLARINSALGLDARRPLRFIHARGKGLAAILPKVRKAVKDHGIEVVVLDSISRGGFGDLNANQVGNAWIDAMNGLSVAWVAIGHQPRPREDGGPPHLYGSIFQDAGADVLVSLQSKAVEGNRLLVTLTVSDANDFAKPDPIDLTYEFDGEGLVRIRHAAGDELVELEEMKPLKGRDAIVALLRDEGPAKSADLSKKLKRSQTNVSRDLGLLSRDGLVERGTDGVWSVSRQVDNYQPSKDDNYHDKAPRFESGGGHLSFSYHDNYHDKPAKPAPPELSGGLPPLRGGRNDNGADKASDTDLIECSKCRRRAVLAGFDPNSDPDNPGMLCASCADDVLGGVA